MKAFRSLVFACVALPACTQGLTVVDARADALPEVAPSPPDAIERDEAPAPDALVADVIAFNDVAPSLDAPVDRVDPPADVATPLDAALPDEAPAPLDAPSPDAPVVDVAPAPDALTPDAAPPATDWISGALDRESLPPRSELRALPGAGEGPPVFTSNNPEQFDGNGLLYGTGRPSPARGGATYPLSGSFGVYFHHINHGAAVRYVSLFVTNPGSAAVTVQARGSGYSQTETGGLGLGTSPDYRVSDEWINDRPATVVPATSVPPERPLLLWRTRVNTNAEIDGRFSVQSSGPVYAYLVVTTGADLNEAVSLSRTDAPGIIARSGTPPPPFGREAGVYAHDTWRGTIDTTVPAGPRRVGFMVNTATGGGSAQVQAFASLTNYSDSARESVGQYGNVYDLTVQLAHDGRDANTRRVRVVFSSYVSGAISRYWDGTATVDGRSVVLRHTPAGRSTVLADVSLARGERRSVRFRAMVPGLTSIPQALFLESY